MTACARRCRRARCIADSVELTVRGHAYDALVGLAGCDKSLPGMMMAMVRLNVPSIFIYGGSILPGNFRGQQVTVQDMFEAVGKHSVGEMSDADLDEIERVACPSAGACGAQFTANTMATVSEAIGLALPYSAGAPAPYEIRDAFLHHRRREGDGADRSQHPAARHRHPRDRWRTPPPSSPPPAGRPMLRCTCRRSPTNAASSSTCSTLRKSSKRLRMSRI